MKPLKKKEGLLSTLNNSFIQYYYFTNEFDILQDLDIAAVKEIFVNLTRKKYNTIHDNIQCSGCMKKPIKGIRFKCTSCTDYNLCEICEFCENHSSRYNHILVMLPFAVDTIPYYLNLLPAIPDENATAHSENCSQCTKLITGNRYKCANCKKLDLCEVCYCYSGHNENHPMFKIVYPLIGFPDTKTAN